MSRKQCGGTVRCVVRFVLGVANVAIWLLMGIGGAAYAKMLLGLLPG